MKDRREAIRDFYSQQEESFYVRFFAGPLDGVEGQTPKLFERLMIPVNPGMVDSPESITQALNSQLPPSSVAVYSLNTAGKPSLLRL